MTTTFIARSADHVLEKGGADVIWSTGDTPEAAIAKAVEYGGADHCGAEDFQALPASHALAEVLKQGDSPTGYRIVNGVADIERDPDDYDGLARALIDAAQVATEEEFENAPEVLYVQLSNLDGWRARFSDEHDSEMDMTRWNTGAKVVELYGKIKGGDYEAAVDEAGNIEAGWDDEWTEE